MCVYAVTIDHVCVCVYAVTIDESLVEQCMHVCVCMSEIINYSHRLSCPFTPSTIFIVIFTSSAISTSYR